MDGSCYVRAVICSCPGPLTSVALQLQLLCMVPGLTGLVVRDITQLEQRFDAVQNTVCGPRAGFFVSPMGLLYQSSVANGMASLYSLRCFTQLCQEGLSEEERFRATDTLRQEVTT